MEYCIITKCIVYARYRQTGIIILTLSTVLYSVHVCKLKLYISFWSTRIMEENSHGA